MYVKMYVKNVRTNVRTNVRKNVRIKRKEMERYCMINMNNIGGIIDMDGFTVNKTFYCKEIGLLNIHKEVGNEQTKH